MKKTLKAFEFSLPLTFQISNRKISIVGENNICSFICTISF